MRINLEINELEAFISVARKSSFKAAAEGLFISQPALSRRIEKLEASLQTRLLERTTRRVSLTEAGRQFLVHADAVMEELALAMQGMAQRTTQRAEHVTVACVPSVAHYVLPEVLKEFSRRFPEVRIKVIDEGAKEVLDSVVSGLADFGVNFIGTQEADIDFKAIRTERYVLMVRGNHPLAKQKSVKWEALAGEKLVSVSQSSGNRMLIDNALASVAQRPRIFYEINHVAGALGMASAGLGIAVLPELALTKAFHPKLVSIPLSDPAITRTLGLIVRKGGRLSPPAQLLSDLVESAVAQR
jgi:DNA-binding transcriptional LysR family regulator